MIYAYFWKQNLVNKIISNANHYDDAWTTVSENNVFDGYLDDIPDQFIKRLQSLRLCGHQHNDRWPWGTGFEDESTFWNPNPQVESQVSDLQEDVAQLANDIIKLYRSKQ